jgi:hypothetical protein
VHQKCSKNIYIYKLTFRHPNIMNSIFINQMDHAQTGIENRPENNV